MESEVLQAILGAFTKIVNELEDIKSILNKEKQTNSIIKTQSKHFVENKGLSSPGTIIEAGDFYKENCVDHLTQVDKLANKVYMSQIKPAKHQNKIENNENALSNKEHITKNIIGNKTAMDDIKCKKDTDNSIKTINETCSDILKNKQGTCDNSSKVTQPILKVNKTKQEQSKNTIKEKQEICKSPVKKEQKICNDTVKSNNNTCNYITMMKGNEIKEETTMHSKIAIDELQKKIVELHSQVQQTNQMLGEMKRTRREEVHENAVSDLTEVQKKKERKIEKLLHINNTTGPIEPAKLLKNISTQAIENKRSKQKETVSMTQNSQMLNKWKYFDPEYGLKEEAKALKNGCSLKMLSQKKQTNSKLVQIYNPQEEKQTGGYDFFNLLEKEVEETL